MDEKEIQALLTAIRVGSFSRAAEELGYTQPGLTQMMNRMERELGCKVLCRSYSGVQLTLEGQKLLPFFENVSRSLSALHGEIEHLRAGNGQVIRIAAYPSVAKSILPSLIQKFQAHNPNITLELQISGYDIREWVSSGIVDLAFVDEGLGEKQDWLPLFRDPYFVAVSADSPLSTRKSVTVQDLADQAFILSQINELKPLSRLGKLREQLHINASDDTAVLSLVEQGLGVTILPESSLKGHSDKIRVLSLDPPLRRTIGIVRSKTVNRSADEFVDFSSRELRRAD